MKLIDKFKLFSPVHHKLKFDVILFFVFSSTLLGLILGDESELTKGQNIFIYLAGIVVIFNAKISDLFLFLADMKKELRYDLWVKYQQSSLYKIVFKSFIPYAIVNFLIICGYIYLMFISEDLTDKILFFIIAAAALVLPSIIVYNNYLKIK